MQILPQHTVYPFRCQHKRMGCVIRSFQLFTAWRLEIRQRLCRKLCKLRQQRKWVCFFRKSCLTLFRYKVLSGRARRIPRKMPLSEDSLLKGADTIFAEKGCGRCTVEEWFHIALGWCTSLNAAVVSEFFEGEERVAAMGVQAASVGAGMTLLSALSGILGKYGFRGSYFTNLVAFLCFAVIALFLPDTGLEKETENEKVGINGKVLAPC